MCHLLSQQFLNHRLPLGPGGPKPETSHFVIFGFNPQNQETSLKVSTKTLTEEISLREKVEPSA